MWNPPIFEPSQAFLFGSLDFVTDRLGVLHLHEEALVPTLVEGDTSSIGSGTPNDFNGEVPALRSEHMLCSNPTVSNVCTVIYCLSPILRRDPVVPAATTMRLVSLRPRVPRGHVRLGAPKDAGAAPSHIRIRGDGELRSRLFS